MSAITTHVLDLTSGRPAAGVAVRLLRDEGAGLWQPAGHGVTDDDGRLASLLPDGERPEPGPWRLVFETGKWFAARDVPCFHPEVVICFVVTDAGQHHHVPLLLSPFGYSTYRGS